MMERHLFEKADYSLSACFGVKKLATKSLIVTGNNKTGAVRVGERMYYEKKRKSTEFTSSGCDGIGKDACDWREQTPWKD